MLQVSPRAFPSPKSCPRGVKSGVPLARHCVLLAKTMARRLGWDEVVEL